MMLVKTLSCSKRRSVNKQTDQEAVMATHFAGRMQSRTELRISTAATRSRSAATIHRLSDYVELTPAEVRCRTMQIKNGWHAAEREARWQAGRDARIRLAHMLRHVLNPS